MHPHLIWHEDPLFLQPTQKSNQDQIIVQSDFGRTYKLTNTKQSIQFADQNV